MTKQFALIIVTLCILSIAPASEQRLVSLAPSLTEMLFELGGGSQLVGVTQQCRYPPEAKTIQKIGDYQTPNIETIMTLAPTRVLALQEHAPIFPLLEDIGLTPDVFNHRSLPGILDSLTKLGDLCRQQQTAAKLKERLETAFAPKTTENRAKILFLIGRDYGQGTIANAYAVGKDNLYEHLFAAAGCQNAYPGDLAYPSLSGEGVASLRPDIIVEAVGGEMGATLPTEILRRDWASLANLPAVQSGRIYYLTGDYVFIPGMRLIQLKDDLQKIADAFAETRSP